MARVLKAPEIKLAVDLNMTRVASRLMLLNSVVRMERPLATHMSQRYSLHAGTARQRTPLELSAQYGVSASEWRRTKRVLGAHRRRIARDVALLVAVHGLALLGVTLGVAFAAPSPGMGAIACGVPSVALAASCGALAWYYWAEIVPRRRAAACGVLTRTMFGYKGLAVVYRRGYAGMDAAGFFLVPWADDAPEPFGLGGRTPKRQLTLGSRHSSAPFSSTHASHSSRRLSATRLSRLLDAAAPTGGRAPAHGTPARGARGSAATVDAAARSAAAATARAEQRAAAARSALTPVRSVPPIALGSVAPPVAPSARPPSSPVVPLLSVPTGGLDALSYLPHDAREVLDAIRRLPQLAIGASSTDPRVRLDAIISISRLLAREHDPPIDAALSAGALPSLAAALRAAGSGGEGEVGVDDDDATKSVGVEAAMISETLVEATWALTNITAGSSEHAAAVVASGCVADLVRLGGASDTQLAEQAVWALGNLAGDSASARDAVLQHGGAAVLASHLAATDRPALARTACWVACNVARTEPRPPRAAVAPLLGGLASALQLRAAPPDEENTAQALWAFIHLCAPSAPARADTAGGGNDGGDDGGEMYGHDEARLAAAAIAAALSARGLRALGELCAHNALLLCRPAVRLLALLAGADANVADAVSERRGRHFASLPHPRVLAVARQQEACDALHSLLSAAPAHLDAALDARLVPALCALLGDEATPPPVLRAAADALCGAVARASAEQRARIGADGALAPLCALVRTADAHLTADATDALARMLAPAERALVRKPTHSWRRNSMDSKACQLILAATAPQLQQRDSSWCSGRGGDANLLSV
ncbi:hypothetical protein KFE25_003344 [Diacronema lutheri]|uniref:Uncharacterized protein n=1 Tax=Diacronema lutheri TaxID=2081491 RepID=A0A8J5XFQ6_DIALT|nr:hypothetical protein KFE25_003344 [Diacronema lutheri]